MKSVGEVMAIGRSFAESLQKALRGLETGLAGLDPVELPGTDGDEIDRQRVMAALSEPTSDRLLIVSQALRAGMRIEAVHAACPIDSWFLARIKEIVEAAAPTAPDRLPNPPPVRLAAPTTGSSPTQHSPPHR